MKAIATNQKTSVYFNPIVKDFLQHKAVEDDTTLSALVNSYVFEAIEDTLDRAVASKRNSEASRPFNELIADLGLTYDDLRN